MTYPYSRTAFKAAAKSAQPLLALYTSLVHLELALKACNPDFFSKGHDICGMLDSYDRVICLVESLKKGLSRICCIDKDGKPSRVRHDKYPDMRYLIHDQDKVSLDSGEKHGTSDHDLKILADIVSDILVQLKKNHKMRPYL